MSHEEVMKMVGEMGLSFAYDHFVEGESPEPPFLVFLYPKAAPAYGCPPKPRRAGRSRERPW